MIVGMILNAIGLALSFYTRNPFFLITGIFIFSIGEMSFSPKILEYIGKIAPSDKAALYMGTQFLPIAFGNFLGGFISGGVYEKFADRMALTRDIPREDACGGIEIDHFGEGLIGCPEGNRSVSSRDRCAAGQAQNKQQRQRHGHHPDRGSGGASHQRRVRPLLRRGHRLDPAAPGRHRIPAPAAAGSQPSPGPSTPSPAANGVMTCRHR